MAGFLGPCPSSDWREAGCVVRGGEHAHNAVQLGATPCDGAGVDAEALVIRCGRRLTALLVGFDNGGQAELAAAGAPDGWRCRDIERRFERLDSTGSSCSVWLARHDVRLIEMESR